MKRLSWADDALADLEEQIAFIARDDPRSAALVAGRIDAAVRKLLARSIGRPGRVAGTYEKSIDKTSLIVAYELLDAGETLAILRIMHAARDWKPGKFPD